MVPFHIYSRSQLLFLSVDHCMQLLVRVGVVLVNRSTPVVVMSPDHLWPLGSMLSFPTGIAGTYVQSMFHVRSASYIVM